MQQFRSPPLALAQAFAVFLALLVLAGVPSPDSAEAGWITRIGRLGGEAGGVGAKAGKAAGIGGALGEAASVMAKLPPAEKGAAALAAHATPEGHWKFVNREGEVFTAANAEELAHVTQTLAPELASGGKLSLYLSDDAVFAQRGLLKDLPADAELHLVSGHESYKLVRTSSAGEVGLAAEIRPNVSLALTESDLFREAVFHLGRPLKKSSIRLLSLSPGGPKGLGTVPRFDPVKKTALVDEVDPAALTGALSNVKGQTVMLTGRVDGERLIYRGASGADEAIDIASLKGAAEAADVNLILLDSPANRQPGGRNWMWQEVKVSGLDEALENKTFADFLDTLGGSNGALSVTAARDSYGRIAVQAMPVDTSVVPVPPAVSETWSEILGETTGHLAVRSVHVFARDREREEELDARFIPGIPSWLQILYLGSVIAGLIAWETTQRWWSRIWPPEARADYGSAIGYGAARMARLLAFVFLFLPFAGGPAILWLFLLQLWEAILTPFRFLRWIGRKINFLASREANPSRKA